MGRLFVGKISHWEREQAGLSCVRGAPPLIAARTLFAGNASEPHDCRNRRPGARVPAWIAHRKAERAATYPFGAPSRFSGMASDLQSTTRRSWRRFLETYEPLR